METINSYYSTEYQDNCDEKLLQEININQTLSQQKNIMKKMKLLLSVIIIISLCAFIIGAINLIEYNIVLRNFNGFSGIETFINKTTVVIDNLNHVLSKINETEAESYIRKLRILIDRACQSIKC
tara:strand:- start:244 stop:618 length:375 start_codon:yes stop_codon:yes gene_type:complete